MSSSEGEVHVLVVAVLVVGKTGYQCVEVEIRGSEIVASKEFGVHKIQMVLHCQVDLEVVSSPDLKRGFVNCGSEQFASVAFCLEVCNSVRDPLIGPVS